jgi:hypothetical protein
LVPDFDPACALTTSDHTKFKMLLMTRLRSITLSKDKDWMKLSAQTQLWQLLGTVSNEVTKATAAWAPRNAGDNFFYLDGLAAGNQAQQAVLEACGRLAGHLKQIASGGGLAQLLCDAVFNPPLSPQAPPREFWKVITKSFFDSSSTDFAEQSDTDQATIANMKRFPELHTALRQHVVKCFADSGSFERAVAALLGSGSDWVAVTFLPPLAGAPVKVTLSWRNEAATAGLGHRIVQLWFEHIVGRVEGQTAQWAVPPTCINEANKAERVLRLKNMAETLVVLESLETLQAKFAQRHTPG